MSSQSFTKGLITGILLDSIVFVNSKSDFPTAVAGVITLLDNYTYFITTTVDLLGDRLVCGINTTIIGGSSENCRIKSTGLTGTALITSNYSLPIRNITIEADVALNLQGDGVTTALDWFGVNFTDCATVGTKRRVPLHGHQHGGRGRGNRPAARHAPEDCRRLRR